MDLAEQTERIQTHYGLKHDPFGALVDSMVFSSAGHRYEMAETLRHLLTYSPQDSILLGPVGIGKRSVTAQVIKLLDPQWRVAWVDAGALASLADFYQELIGQLGLGLRANEIDSDAANDILEAIKERAADESFLLIAQNLASAPDGLSAALLELRAGAVDIDERLRQIWLVDREADLPAQLNEQDWYVQTLLPFSEGDAYQYLKDRFVAAGSVKEFPIDTKDVVRLNDIAHGIPQALNEVARDYLISSTFQSPEQRRSFPVTHVAAGAAALTLVVIAILYQANESYNKKSVTPSAPVESETALPKSAVEQKLAEAVAQVEAKQTPDVSSPLEPSYRQTNSAINLASAAVAKPDNETASGEFNTAATTLPTATPPAFNVEPAVEPPKAQQIGLTQQSQSSTLITTASGTEYTLQLIGVRDKTKLSPLLSQFKTNAPVEIVETRYKNAAWYVLIYGHYPDKPTAQLAVAELPDGLGIADPWVRTFDSLRKSQ